MTEFASIARFGALSPPAETFTVLELQATAGDYAKWLEAKFTDQDRPALLEEQGERYVVVGEPTTEAIRINQSGKTVHTKALDGEATVSTYEPHQGLLTLLTHSFSTRPSREQGNAIFFSTQPSNTRYAGPSDLAQLKADFDRLNQPK